MLPATALELLCIYDNSILNNLYVFFLIVAVLFNLYFKLMQRKKLLTTGSHFSYDIKGSTNMIKKQ